MPKVTWKGAPSDPEQIEQFGTIFPKGEAVDCSASPKHIAKLRGNPHFDVEGDADAEDGEALFNPVHKGRGRWIVTGPEGTPDYGPFSKEEATAKAAELNAAPVKGADAEDGA
jgi:hypothetical protein